MELVALKALKYGSPRRPIKPGERFETVTDKHAKVLVALRLAGIPTGSYETTHFGSAPVVRGPRGRFVRAPSAAALTTSNAEPIVERPRRAPRYRGDESA
jgi:hypothetical protein